LKPKKRGAIMADEGFKHRINAILSANAVEYSRLMADDEEATVRTLKTYREVLSTPNVAYQAKDILG
jgi:adenylate cyclase